MAVGDIVSTNASIAAGAYLAIQPSAGIEAVVHNIYHSHDITIEWYDGTNAIACTGTLSGAGIETNLQCHCTNAFYIRVKNADGSARRIGYDGIQTK